MAEQKSMAIAMILSFFFEGIGNVYVGLTKRGLVEFTIGLILGLLGSFVTVILSYIAVVWWIYVLYDTYQCTKAVNNNQMIPKFLFSIDL